MDVDPKDQQEFDKFQPVVRAYAARHFQCACAWCCYRAYNTLTGHTDPGLPTQAIAGEMVHQGAALPAD